MLHLLKRLHGWQKSAFNFHRSEYFTDRRCVISSVCVPLKETDRLCESWVLKEGNNLFLVAFPDRTEKHSTMPDSPVDVKTQSRLTPPAMPPPPTTQGAPRTSSFTPTTCKYSVLNWRFQFERVNWNFSAHKKQSSRKNKIQYQRFMQNQVQKPWKFASGNGYWTQTKVSCFRYNWYNCEYLPAFILFLQHCNPPWFEQMNNITFAPLV